MPDEPHARPLADGTLARSAAPPQPTVRLATPDDMPGLAALAAATFPLACPPSVGPADADAFVAAHLSPERFAGHLVDPDHRVLVASDESGTLLGYTLLVLGEPHDEHAAAAVTLRPVQPSSHGTGVAAALMAASLAMARDLGAAGIWLGVNRHNVRAQRFYAKSGFAVVGTKHFTVGSVREDDYVMERAL